MKISYFNYTEDVEGHSIGAVNKSESFVGGLRKLGHEVHINWLLRDTRPSLSGVVREEARLWIKSKLRKYAFEPKMLLKNRSLYLKEKQALDQQQPDVILDRLDPFFVAGTYLASRRRIPLVIECDGPSRYEYMTHLGPDNFHIPGMLRLIERYRLGRADACFLISEELRRFFISLGVDDRKLHVIPNGADPERFYPQPPRPELLARYPLEGKTVVGWAGSLYGWSGIEKLVGMVKELVATREDVSFLFLCGGENKRFFQRHFPETDYGDRVILPGMISHDQVNAYFSCMDIVLAPYPYQELWYASSLKIFEYMAAGKTVISSGIGQVAEIIQDGVNGFLVDPRSPDELVEKVRFLIDEPELRRRVGAQARESVLASYTWDIQARKMAAVFEGVVESHARRR